jgi:thioredoxin-related protein
MRARIARWLPWMLLIAAPLQAAPATLRWREWDAGLKEARDKKLPVLVDVYTDWCGWCKRMDRDVYSQPEVREYLSRKFVIVKLDAEAGDPARYQDQDFTARSLASHFGITGYPTTIFLRASGDHLINAPGYIPADRFLSVLRYIGDGYMDRGVTWEQFKQQGSKTK